MRLILLLTCFAVACGGTSTTPGRAPAPRPTAEARSGATPAPDPGEAKTFLARVDDDLRRLFDVHSEAEWSAAGESEAFARYIAAAIVESRRFDAIKDRLDQDSRRQLSLLRALGDTLPAAPADANELSALRARNDDAFKAAKACDASGKCRTFAELQKLLAAGGPPAELKAAWEGWHNSAGEAVGPSFPRLVELANAGARQGGFADAAAMWRAGYDMTPDEIEGEVDRIWSQVEPLYRELHCYARRRLNKKYGDQAVPPRGPLPVHLLGDLFSANLDALYPLLEPYPKVGQLDVGRALAQQKYDPKRMVSLAEGFFTSLGTHPLPATLWERVNLLKPEGIEVSHEDLIELHHEIGHEYYFQAWRSLPRLYWGGPNPAFNDAIGETGVLSITPGYLTKVGLLKKDAGLDQQRSLNEQMKAGLHGIGFLPYGILVAAWRRDVFSGRVPPGRYNEHWWELRRKYQGVAPPSPREGGFDPAAKRHIGDRMPYLSYVFMNVLQFQMHRGLCRISKQGGPLHECSIYGSKEAGAALTSMHALGASMPWPEALFRVSGERSLDPGAMLEYFAPLRAWLARENRDQSCGW